ncbi:putative glycosyltransferase [Christiangramia flava JLT2011]|uniref:Colanic acid biosynthesis glycosyl transferase WcaE n=1 Tax=Christiangramia flava JLT2011 TaxID=1229726 RepID=A0A1L7I654_9FLAO|nr:Colanic acid biosynthesis glycosyl transferase WcaE [Christiangramia flava JLT2011]OSS38187.1 putative glycosyltransferase [Christiangramia flava JLT2011]
MIDGGSTDGTLEIIENYKDDLGYFVSEMDNGLYDALNKGIQKCTGDVIGILHSDDLYYKKDTLEKIAETFNRTDADLVYAKGKYVDKEDISKIKRLYPSKDYKPKYLNFGWIPLHTTIYVKKEVFEKFGLYNLRYSIASDYDISLRWFKNDQIKKVFLDEWVVKMRLGGKSTTASLQKKKSSEDLKIIKKHGLRGKFTLACKIVRKIPQYLIPRLIAS